MSTKVDLSPLIEQARKERKWLWCHYQDMWFSPDELERLNSEGRFLWGPVNWKLRDPKEKLECLEQNIKAAESELALFKKELYGIE